MKKTAIILGATGLTGSLLLELLIDDPRYEKIKLFSRRKSDVVSPKIEEHIIDLFRLKEYQSDFTADVVFCCVGTTKAKTPDKDTYRKIDFGIPTEAAVLAQQNGIENFIVISSLGANPKSSVFYSKLKGEMETLVLAKEIKNTYILQPSLIVGKRKEGRLGEGMAAGFMNVLNFMIPAKYKSISAKAIAKAMQKLAENGYSKSRIPSDEIKKIAKS